jgi:hypothetical protein
MATHESGSKNGIDDDIRKKGGKVHEVHWVPFLFSFDVSAEQHVQISKRILRRLLE